MSLEIIDQSQHDYGAATAHLTESGVNAAQGQHVPSTATEHLDVSAVEASEAQSVPSTTTGHLAESGADAAQTLSVCIAASHNYVIYLYVYCDILTTSVQRRK